jgi:predicted PurR-regulated permease PerM
MTHLEPAAKTIALGLLFALLVVGLATSLVVATDVYLLIFLAILCAVLFVHLAERLGRFTSLPYAANLGMTVIAVLALSIGTVVVLANRIENQIRQTSDRVDQSFARVEAWIRDRPPVRAALSRVPFVNDLINVQHGSQTNPRENRGPQGNSFRRGKISVRGKTQRKKSEVFQRGSLRPMR